MAPSAEAFALAEAELADAAKHIEDIRAEVDRGIPAGSSARGDALRANLAEIETHLRALMDELMQGNREEASDAR